MDARVFRGFEHETLEAKARWFRSLNVEERLSQMSAYYDLAVALNPKLREGTDDHRPGAVVRVLSLGRH